jgi:hypothetical protein
MRQLQPCILPLTKNAGQIPFRQERPVMPARTQFARAINYPACSEEEEEAELIAHPDPTTCCKSRGSSC